MKKNRKRKGSKILLAVILCSLLCNGVSGCGNSESGMDAVSNNSYKNTDSAYGMQDNAAVETEDVQEEKAVSGSTSADSGTSDNSDMAAADIQNNGKKIIKNYYYDYETEKFDEAYAYLKQQIEQYQGYISSCEVAGTNYRTLNLTARIPAQNSDEFANSMGSLGTVISQSESAEDVTLQYTDTESRIASLKTEQQRLNELLEKADNLENIIALEERLTEVRYELENYQSQKNLYDDMITYSTVNITLNEVSYTVAVDDDTFISRISTGLEKSFRDIRNGFINFLVTLIVSLPYLVIWGIILFVIIWIIRKIVRRRRRKKQDMAVGQTEPAAGEKSDISQKEGSSSKKE